MFLCQACFCKEIEREEREKQMRRCLLSGVGSLEHLGRSKSSLANTHGSSGVLELVLKEICVCGS